MAYLNFQEAQVAGSLLNAVFAIMLFALTFRRLHGVPKVSAQLMGLGFFLSAVQFALQRIFCFHDIDLMLGITTNLGFFMIVTYLLFMAVLYLLRQGRIRQREWFGVPLLWLCCIVLMAGARLLSSDDRIPMWANYITAAAYLVEVAYMYYLLHTTYKRLRKDVEEFFDRSTHEMFCWVTVSARLISLMSFVLPVILFFRSWWLIIFIYVILLAMAYLCVTFTFFCVSSDALIASQAEAIAGETMSTVAVPADGEPTGPALEVIEARMGSWQDDKGFLHHELSIKDVAESLELSVADIRRWLAATEKGMFSQWLSKLRVDHAKQLPLDQKNWTIDAIADECGFTNRQSFARAFKKETGSSPTDWASKAAGKEQKQ